MCDPKPNNFAGRSVGGVGLLAPPPPVIATALSKLQRA